MSTNKLHALIDRAIGKKGILRVPSWWMNKILSEITGTMIPIQKEFTNEFNEDFTI